MDASTIKAQTFQIKQGTTVINGTYAATADPKVYTFKPSVALSPFMVYTGTVTTGAIDTFSTAMQENYVWSLTTIPVVSLIANPLVGGTVSSAGAFAQGSSVTVVASPLNGYSFANWTENGTIVSTSASYQFVLTGNRTLVANYSVIPASQLSVTLSSNLAAGGSTDGRVPMQLAHQLLFKS